MYIKAYMNNLESSHLNQTVSVSEDKSDEKSKNSSSKNSQKLTSNAGVIEDLEVSESMRKIKKIKAKVRRKNRDSKVNIIKFDPIELNQTSFLFLLMQSMFIDA